MAKKLIYIFQSKIKKEKLIEELGNKGTQLYNMTHQGLPVPPGFTIPVSVCQYYYQHHHSLPPQLKEKVKAGLEFLETATSKGLSNPENPLTVSARSGAALSMPGMMETILNLGLNEEIVNHQAKKHQADENKLRWLYDSYTRLYQMWGENVFDIKKDVFRQAFDEIRQERDISKLTSSDFRKILSKYKRKFSNRNLVLIQDPFEQIWQAIITIIKSWNKDTARNYREEKGLGEFSKKTDIPVLGTAVNIVAMVYGNLGNDCATGVGFTRNPATGKKEPYGDFLINAQGEEVVSGERTPHDNLEELVHLGLEQPYQELRAIYNNLEKHYRAVQDLEWTIEEGKLWMLQTRDGKLSGRASVVANRALWEEDNLIPEKEALERISCSDVEQLLFANIDYQVLKKEIRKKGKTLEEITINYQEKVGVKASPGAGKGYVVFDWQTAKQWAEKGIPVVLLRTETNPSDYPGFVAAKRNGGGVGTAKGGKTSHAAVVARQDGIPAATGTEIEINEEKKYFEYLSKAGQTIKVKQGRLVQEGKGWKVKETKILVDGEERNNLSSLVAVDGYQGKLIHYDCPLIPPDPADPDLQRHLEWITPLAEKTGIEVYANADKADSCQTLLELGAAGNGLLRTEHQFIEDKRKEENRRALVQQIYLTAEEGKRKSPLRKLKKLQVKDFLDVYRVMREKPVIVRLFDLPLHEMMSGVEENLEFLVKKTKLSAEEIKGEVERTKEENPMLGDRSVRFGILRPDFYQMQVQALLQAAKQVNEESKRNKGKKVTPYIELPLVGSAEEIREVLEKIIEPLAEEYGFVRYNKRRKQSTKKTKVYKVGAMIELPAACKMAAQLAEILDFFSFGTNDLTQTTLGLSRDDTGRIIASYLEKGIYADDPFSVIAEPVAKLMADAVMSARKVKPDFEIGICGVHAGIEESIDICYGLGLNNLSPPPLAVPLTYHRLAQLCLLGKEKGWLLGEYKKK